MNDYLAESKACNTPSVELNGMKSFFYHFYDHIMDREI